MVVHSGFMRRVYFDEWFVEQSAKFFREFLAGRPDSFELLIENVLDADPVCLRDMVEAIGDRRAGVCLDVGHAHVASKAPVRNGCASSRRTSGTSMRTTTTARSMPTFRPARERSAFPSCSVKLPRSPRRRR